MVEARTVSDMGESGLIERLGRFLPDTLPDDVIAGIGDDAAVIRLDDRRCLLATCDVLVEGVHFRLDQTTPRLLGRKSVAVNLSDIAAMGGKPTLALVSLALPPDLPQEVFDELYRGIVGQCTEAGVAIVGGNLARSTGGLVVDVFMLGEAVPNRVITRRGARPGERILVTGALGASAAGLMVLNKYGEVFPERFNSLVQAHRLPRPRLAEAALLAEAQLATAMIDISDGLIADLKHLCAASSVGARIQADWLSLSDDLTAAALKVSAEPLKLALAGGEDYELLFTVKPNAPSSVLQEIAATTGTPITEIGSIVPAGEGVIVKDSKGRVLFSDAMGWDHFHG